jgi:hypothetical protein
MPDNKPANPPVHVPQPKQAVTNAAFFYQSLSI